MKKTNEPMIPSTGVKDATAASGSKPRSNTKKDRTLPAKSDMKKLEAHSRNNKSSVKQKNYVDSSINFKRIVINSNCTSVCKTCNKCLMFIKKPPVNKPTGRKFTLGEQYPLTRFTESKVMPAKQPESVLQIVLWYLDSGCSKHMTGDRSRLRNFVKKFTRTVRFRNDHFGAIMGYEDYVIGDSVIFRVYYVEGLGHNLFSVRQFCDSNLKVAFRKHSCYVRDTDGVELIKGSRGFNLYTISVEDMMKSSPICLLSKASKTKSWLWHRRLNHLNFSTINDLERKDLVLTQYYESVGIFHQKSVPRTPQQNGVVERRNRTLVEAARTMLIISKALMFLWAEAVATASPYVPLTNKELEILFQPMFDEYLEPPCVERPFSPALAFPVPVNSVGIPSSTTIDQDTPSPSHSSSSSELQSPSSQQGVEDGSTNIEDNPFSPVDNAPFINVFASEPSYEASSSGDASSAESTYVTQTHHHLEK
ncbi:integrase, catalytic region, zinc finger, CCHC-type containing protein [Tanacetum coccineum]